MRLGPPARPLCAFALLVYAAGANAEKRAVKEQKLSQAAAAIYVITSEDIRRSGFTSIPEALRMVPGFQVARISATEWAITARGFTSKHANKLLRMDWEFSERNSLTYAKITWRF